MMKIRKWFLKAVSYVLSAWSDEEWTDTKNGTLHITSTNTEFRGSMVRIEGCIVILLFISLYESLAKVISPVRNDTYQLNK